MRKEKIKITLLSYSTFKYNQFKKGAVAMDIIEHIFQYEEIINIERNNEIYDLVLNEFLNSSKKRFIFDENITSADKVRRLKDQYIYTSKDIKIFFNILILSFPLIRIIPIPPAPVAVAIAAIVLILPFLLSLIH